MTNGQRHSRLRGDDVTSVLIYSEEKLINNIKLIFHPPAHHTSPAMHGNSTAV